MERTPRSKTTDLVCGTGVQPQQAAGTCEHQGCEIHARGASDRVAQLPEPFQRARALESPQRR